MIRTLIAEHCSLIRAGLVTLLSCADDIEIVAELERGGDVVPASRALLPDVAVLAALHQGWWWSLLRLRLTLTLALRCGSDRQASRHHQL